MIARIVCDGCGEESHFAGSTRQDTLRESLERGWFFTTSQRRGQALQTLAYCPKEECAGVQRAADEAARAERRARREARAAEEVRSR